MDTNEMNEEYEYSLVTFDGDDYSIDYFLDSWLHHCTKEEKIEY